MFDFVSHKIDLSDFVFLAFFDHNDPDHNERDSEYKRENGLAQINRQYSPVSQRAWVNLKEMNGSNNHVSHKSEHDHSAYGCQENPPW